MHGGGYVCAGINDYQIVARYAAATSVPLLSVDYRLAPEANGSSLVEDCYAGLMYLHAHAKELSVDSARIAVMGDSAGGGFAALLCHYAKHMKDPAIKMQTLMCPMLEDCESAKR